MPRMTPFDSPFLLGFEQIEQMLDRLGRSGNDGYPPYNIERVDSQILRLTFAVAGFEESDLSVTIEDQQLMIRGRREEEEEREYLHRGIATRQFQRAFVLAEGIEVHNAHLHNGLLNIDLIRPVPETVVRKIEISSPGQKRPSKQPLLKVEAAE